MAKAEDEHTVADHGEVVVKSEPEERQSVEIRPMRWVLGVGLGLVVAGFLAAYLVA